MQFRAIQFKRFFVCLGGVVFLALSEIHMVGSALMISVDLAAVHFCT